MGLMRTFARIQSLLIISELQSQELWQQIKISDHFLKYPPDQSEWVILVTWVSQLKESHIGHQAVSGIGRVWSQSRPTISGAGERRGVSRRPGTQQHTPSPLPHRDKVWEKSNPSLVGSIHKVKLSNLTMNMRPINYFLDTKNCKDTKYNINVPFTTKRLVPSLNL